MNKPGNEVVRPYPPRLQWWLDARLGISYHWGLYALPARGEWVRSLERLTLEQYAHYFDRFNPDRCDMRQWAAAAKAAGMKYAIFTTKHHDGFCLFDSALTGYKSTRTPAGRDFVREYVEAFRAAGLRVGLYYSLVDWQHPDCPAYGDRQHPLRHNPAQKDRPANWDNYVRYLHGQVRELLTNYGRIDLLAFDFSYWQYRGEKWGAGELVKMIRQLQPDVILNDRLANGESGSIKEKEASPWTGDFDTCEQNMPHGPTRDDMSRILPWELWITHNNSWGYGSADVEYKAAADIIRTLVSCVSKGGNLTFNLSPDARGQIPARSLADLQTIGGWLDLNGASIYGCGRSDFERPDWGRFTQSGNGRTFYAHILEQPIGHLTLPGLRGRVRNPRLLATGADAFIGDFWNLPVQRFGRPDDIFLNLHKPFAHTWRLPDPVDTVVAMDLVPENEVADEARRQTALPDPRQPF